MRRLLQFRTQGHLCTKASRFYPTGNGEGFKIGLVGERLQRTLAEQGPLVGTKNSSELVDGRSPGPGRLIGFLNLTGVAGGLDPGTP